MNGLLGLLHVPTSSKTNLQVETEVSPTHRTTAARVHRVTVADGSTTSTTGPVLVEGSVSGEIAAVYLMIARYLNDDGMLALCDLSYVDPGTNRTLDDGSVRPDWGWISDRGARPSSLTVEWDGTLVALDDGEKRIPAFVEPIAYGADEQESLYQLEGEYIENPGRDGRAVAAALIFRGGRMEELLVENTTIFGVTRMVRTLPKVGASFRVLDQLALPGDGATGLPGWSQPGPCLCFGEHPLRLVQEPAPAGRYAIGLVAEDPAGSLSQVLADVTVRCGGNAS